MPLRVALLIGPRGGASAGVSTQSLEQSLRQLGLDAAERRGLIEWSPVMPATERALLHVLATEGQPIVQMAVQAEFGSAQYATLSLLDSSNAERKVNVSTLSNGLRERAPALRLIVLGAPAPSGPSDRDEAGVPTVAFAHVMAAATGRTVVVAPKRPGTLAFEDFYLALHAGRTVAEAIAVVNRGGQAAALWAVEGEPDLRVGPSRPAESAPARTEPEVKAPTCKEQAAIRIAIRRAAGAFDVFMCHNTRDKPTILRMAERLKAVGLLPWVDETDLAAGQPWATSLEHQINTIDSALIFIGADGIGPWQEREIHTWLDQSVKRRVPVIPVLLEDAPADFVWPPFLGVLHGIDFRPDTRTQDGFRRMVKGIIQHRGDWSFPDSWPDRYD